jgi:oxaloacetate decarboxylase gamma subunit
LETSLFDQGVALMLVGMGTVFVFLSVLVVGMSMMSMIAVKFAMVSSSGSSASPAGPNEEEVAAISAAIAQHRKTTAE